MNIFKIKLLILLSLCACSHQLNEIKEGLNDALSQFVQREYKNVPINNKKNCPSVKRSSETAIELNSLYELQRENVSKHMKRSVPPVGFATINSRYCPFKSQTKCDSTKLKYRTFDGSCNNEKKSKYGSNNMPYKRVLPPAYDDGKDAPRGSIKPLPNVRTISLTISTPEDFVTSRMNSLQNGQVKNLFTHFGQFLSHDMTQLSTTTG